MKIDIKGAIVTNDDKEVYEWFGMEAVSPKDVSDALLTAAGKPVAVEINSGGGDIFAGAEIYTALKNYKGKVSFLVTGLAGSAASLILCAGESEITPPGMVMIHNVSSYCEGDYRIMDRNSASLKSANQSIAAAIEQKTGKTQTEILAAMNAETWMSSAEAVKFGIVDRVRTESVRLAAAVGSPMLSAETVSKVKNMIRREDANFQEAKAREQELINQLREGAIV